MRFLFTKDNFIKNRKGSSVVTVALVFTIIVAFAALTVDIGLIVLEKSKLSSTVDAAALAGVQELIINPENTENVVKNYVLKNLDSVKQVNVFADNENKTVEVKGLKDVKSYFAGIFGENMQEVSAVAKAQIESIKSMTGVRPLAIVDQAFEYGKEYTLKEGAEDGTTGNYAAIALGGTGTSVYSDNLLNGYSGKINVGDLIQTETGVIAKTTENNINELINRCDHSPPCDYQYYHRNCSRIIFLPVVNTLEVNGRKYVKVLGFATFFLEGTLYKGGHTDVVGRFIKYNAEGETSSEVNNYGTYGIRLVK